MNLDQLVALAENASQLPWEGPGDVPFSAKADLTKAITPAVALALIEVCRAAKAAIPMLEDGYCMLPLDTLRIALAALEAMEGK